MVENNENLRKYLHVKRVCRNLCNGDYDPIFFDNLVCSNSIYPTLRRYYDNHPDNVNPNPTLGDVIRHSFTVVGLNEFDILKAVLTSAFVHANTGMRPYKSTKDLCGRLSVTTVWNMLPEVQSLSNTHDLRLDECIVMLKDYVKEVMDKHYLNVNPTVQDFFNEYSNLRSYASNYKEYRSFVNGVLPNLFVKLQDEIDLTSEDTEAVINHIVDKIDASGYEESMKYIISNHKGRICVVNKIANLLDINFNITSKYIQNTINSVLCEHYEKREDTKPTSSPFDIVGLGSSFPK